MIAKVNNIIEKQSSKGGTYLNITLDVDGKKLSLNSFDRVDQVTFQQAFDQGKYLDVTVEKNEKGYDNLKSVKFIEPGTPRDVSKIIPMTNVTREEHKEVVRAVQEAYKGNNTDDCKLRSMALAYAKDIAVAGKIEVNDIITKAEWFYNYIVSGHIK